MELSSDYWKFAKTRYVKPDGTPTMLHRVKAALRPINRLYGTTTAAQFGPKALRAVRDTLIRQGLARRTVNDYIGVIRHMFKWGASHELVPGSVYMNLCTVEGLPRGRTAAKETDPVKPAPEAHIEAVRIHVSRQVWAMVQLQLLTGARSGELVIMRPIDIDTSANVWTYTPTSHKTAHHGHGRTVYLGPQAQAIVRPFLAGRAVDAFVFSPREAEAERRAKLHAERTTPMSCGNRPGTNRVRARRCEPGERYTPGSYRRAIQRACELADVPSWHPHQLRHNAATRLRREFGIDLAQTILGHRLGSAITELYAEANVEKARAVIAEVG